MVEALSEWGRRLVLLVIGLSFLELLAPENELRKFIRVFVGLLVLAAILQPLLSLSVGDPLKTAQELEDVLAGGEGAEEAGPPSGLMRLEKVRERQARALYQAALRWRTEAAVREVLGTSARVEVQAREEQGREKLRVEVQPPFDDGRGRRSSPRLAAALQAAVAERLGIAPELVSVEVRAGGGGVEEDE
ncbi:MAG: stage III sporulation protein AF [Bacillota bacterium]|nr:stage III sporulation protein AF [Bacillota bacterium]